MLVVTSVIALLLVILFPAFNAIRRSQRVKRTEAVVGALASGVQAYQNDFGVYPPAEFQSGTNRGNRSLVVLLNVKGGASAPYLPSAFYDGGEIRSPLLLDEWDHPFVYFDTSVMKATTAHDYGALGSVQPAVGATGYYNFGRFQLWSCGPNERNDGGKGTALGADDIANFVAQ
jgi:type II secretory pathway pseudopilin PulG